MTLRLRLILAIVALVTVAQGGSFVGTYLVYSHTLYQRLDTQLRGSEQLVDMQLDRDAGLNGSGSADQASPADPGAGAPPASGHDRGPPVVVPAGTFEELLESSGKVLSRNFQESRTAAPPKLPSPLGATPAGRLFTAPASTGSGSYRVLAVISHDATATTVIAIPTSEVTTALHRLVLIEAVAVALLLAILSAGSWLILRRGLRPLERIAGTARTISRGDLSRRVDLAGDTSEVGQLGSAFNTMLDDIQAAFAERDRTEARLRQFLADVSHELRTPLTSIQGFAELFRIGQGDPKVDTATIARRIEGESARMGLLVEDLLLLAKLDQTRPATRAPVDLSVLAADACADAVATDPSRPVRLLAEHPAVIAGDEGHLRQAVANLVTNAIRHTPPGTPVEVSTVVADGEAVLAVRDHGDGLDDDTVIHAFDRFWQADHSRAGTGFGLGLAIVAAVAAEHDGTASAANADGGGAVFTLRLPIEPSGAVDPPGQADPVNPRPASQETPRPS